MLRGAARYFANDFAFSLADGAFLSVHNSNCQKNADYYQVMLRTHFHSINLKPSLILRFRSGNCDGGYRRSLGAQDGFA